MALFQVTSGSNNSSQGGGASGGDRSKVFYDRFFCAMNMNYVNLKIL